jgi:hypothetical protein
MSLFPPEAQKQNATGVCGLEIHKLTRVRRITLVNL